MYRGLEITTEIGCKTNCGYCPQELLKSVYQGDKRLSLQNFMRWVSKVPTDVVIHFSGFCEPLQHPEAVEMIKYAQQRGHEISLYTSMSPATEDSIKKLRGIKFKELCVHETPATVMDFRKYLKGKGYRVARVTQPSSRAGNLKEISRRKGPVKCVRKNQPVLLPNGDLALCCMDYGLQHIIGSLEKSNYDEILDGDEYRSIMAGLNDENADILCKYCDLDPSCAHGSQMIFLAGMGRAGTTWVGQMLAANLNVAYVHEPFNWLSFGVGKYRFKYLDPENPDEHFDKKWRSIESKYPRAVIKDIHTPFTLNYISKHFMPQRIFVLLRNPLSMLDSWVRMGWNVNQQFHMIREQGPLKDLLPEPALDKYIMKKPYAYRFGILWGTIYYLIEKLGDCEIISYDEIANNNVKESMRILGFQATDKGKKFYQDHADLSGKQTHPYTTFRDAEQCLFGWKRNVTVYQLEQLRQAIEVFGYRLEDYWRC